MLYVWLRAQHSPVAVWHEQTKQWQEVNGWQQLHDVYSIHGHKTLCVYFPTSHLLQVDTALSAAQLKQLGTTGKQYLFEEMSIAPVEQLAVRQMGQSQQYLYALAQSDIDTWQQSAALAELSIQVLLPDFLLLPVPAIADETDEQQVMLYQDSDTTLLRQSAYQGLAVSYLPLILERLPKLAEVCALPAIDTSIAGDNDSAVTDKTQSREAETAALITDQQVLFTPLSDLPTPIDTPERHPLNFFVKTSESQSRSCRLICVWRQW